MDIIFDDFPFSTLAMVYLVEETSRQYVKYVTRFT